MKSTDRTYTRLTRNRSGVGTYSSLWLAKNHLLQVTGTGFNEDYARFYFRDIKGAFVTTADASKYLWIVGISVVAPSLAALIYVLLEDGTPTTASVFFVLGMVIVFLAAFWGRNCTVHLVTGVQTVRLISLARRRKAMRVLARIQAQAAAGWTEQAVIGAGPPDAVLVAPPVAKVAPELPPSLAVPSDATPPASTASGESPPSTPPPLADEPARSPIVATPSA